LKPIDEDEIKKFAKGMKGIVTAEEHSIIGGLASVIAFILRGSAIPHIPVGINDRFGQSAHNYDELLTEYNLTNKDIVNAVRQALGVIAVSNYYQRNPVSATCITFILIRSN
jgi:transketolase